MAKLFAFVMQIEPEWRRRRLTLDSVCAGLKTCLENILQSIDAVERQLCERRWWM